MPAFGVIFQIEWREGALRLALPVDPFMIPTPPTPLLATDKREVFVIEAGRWAGEPLTNALAHGLVDQSAGSDPSRAPASRNPL